jgi:hypothetical protein
MSKKLLFGLFVICSVTHGVAWTDGELLIWVGDEKRYKPLMELGKKFEQELGGFCKSGDPREYHRQIPNSSSGR